MANQMRATRIAFGCSISGMNVASSALMMPSVLRTMSTIACQTSRMPKKFKTRRRRSGGRMTAISGSRPTMTVSVWWRVWLQRQVTGLRMIMKQAIW
ncbi:hypothetical protein D9M70_557640 [compost metagenome]